MGSKGAKMAEAPAQLTEKGLLFYLFIVISVKKLFYFQKSPCSKLVAVLATKVNKN